MIVLWCVFFMCLFVVYVVFSWLLMMFVVSGLSVLVVGLGFIVYNFGGVIGVLLCVWVIVYVGLCWLFVLCSIGGVVSVVWLMGVDVSCYMGWLIVGFGLYGLFVNVV